MSRRDAERNRECTDRENCADEPERKGLGPGTLTVDQAHPGKARHFGQSKRGDAKAEQRSSRATEEIGRIGVAARDPDLADFERPGQTDEHEDLRPSGTSRKRQEDSDDRVGDGVFESFRQSDRRPPLARHQGQDNDAEQSRIAGETGQTNEVNKDFRRHRRHRNGYRRDDGGSQQGSLPSGNPALGSHDSWCRPLRSFASSGISTRNTQSIVRPITASESV